MIDHKPKVIVFDVGGVLMDWKGGLISISKLLNQSSEDVMKVVSIYVKDLELGKINEEDFCRYVAQEFSYQGKPHELAKAWIEGQPLIESGWNLLKELKEAGYRIFVCTNNWLGVVENQVKNIPDASLIEMIIDSSQEKVRKPDITIYKIVEERTEETGKDIFFIDDSEENCVAAQKLGWQTYVFKTDDNNGENSRAEISNMLIK